MFVALFSGLWFALSVVTCSKCVVILLEMSSIADVNSAMSWSLAITVDVMTARSWSHLPPLLPSGLFVSICSLRCLFVVSCGRASRLSVLSFGPAASYFRLGSSRFRFLLPLRSFTLVRRSWRSVWSLFGWPRIRAHAVDISSLYSFLVRVTLVMGFGCMIWFSGYIIAGSWPLLSCSC